MRTVLFLIFTVFNSAQQLQDGDILLERVSTSFGEGVEGATGTEWAHVGFVEQTPNQQYFFLEATIPRAKRTPLKKLVQRSKGRLALVRIPSLSSQEIQSILGYAKKQVGKPYDRLFRLDEQDSLYCSELIWAALEQSTDTERMQKSPMDFSGAWDYWKQWFKENPIPQGEPGVAPSDVLSIPGAQILHHYRENPAFPTLTLEHWKPTPQFNALYRASEPLEL